VSIPPSGEQFEIGTGGQRATIVEVGGGLREYEVEGRAVLEPHPVDRIRDGAHGAPLVPWPNRLAGGRYSFDGEDHQLALTEPERRNAIHGLLLWRPWRLVERAGDRLVMGARLHPLPGFPFPLDVGVVYELGEEGLSVTTTAENAGDRACPYGHGQHPYLSPGEGLIDACSLHTSRATTPAGHGLACAEPTEPPPSSGWTRRIRSFRSTPATPCIPGGRGGCSPRSR